MPTLRTRLTDAARSLLGVSAYQAPKPQISAIDLDDPEVRRIRELMGGSLAQLPTSQSDWFLADLALAQLMADAGDMSKIARLSRAMRRDGTIVGLENTRTAGLVALPRRWRGDPDIIADLEEKKGTRRVFDEMFPSAELARLVADGLKCGVGVAELVPVVNRDYPVLIRHDPEFLTYRVTEDRWYFRSLAGLLPITPGDGRWILHTPGGRIAPWNDGIWYALGRAFIQKEHALLARGNFAGKLANPARVAYAPNAATEEQRAGFLAELIRWGINTVFQLPVGWEVKLLESNGRGWEVFKQEIEHDDLDIMIALVGQVVTVTGGSGFANADIHRVVLSDLIAKDARAIEYTINTQGIPAFTIARYGVEKLDVSPHLEYDVSPPKDIESEARAMTTVAGAVKAMTEALAVHDKALDVDEMLTRFGVPLAEDEAPPDVAVAAVTPPPPTAATPGATSESPNEPTDDNSRTPTV